MLRLSRLTDYGTVILTYMGRKPGEVFSVSDMASTLGMAPPTVSKILKILAKHDLVQSRRGSKGGYLLTRSPQDISIAQVIDALESPFGLTECAVADGLCARENSCEIRGQWQDINRIVRRSLEQISLSDMNAAHPLAGGEIPRHAHGKPDIQPR